MSDEFNDSYLTPAKVAEHEIKIKGSRFIGLAFPVDSIGAALSQLDDIRKHDYSATHHCFAYTVGREKEEFKYSDDGEPNGTAGLPIYRVITGRNLKNCLVIVVRYFGGTKLGTGGLTRAYSQAATQVLDKAGTVEKLICRSLRFTLPFSLYDRLMRIVADGGYEIIGQEFSDDISMDVEIRLSHIEGFRNKLIELTGGKIEIEETD